jgi:alkylation response protein AidB-like acyl-CoA dehydrogenase
MDFSLSEEELNWQKTAREFTENEITPISVARDQLEGGFDPFDWSVIEKGSRLGFRTLAVPTEWGGPGAGFVSQFINVWQT